MKKQILQSLLVITTAATLLLQSPVHCSIIRSAELTSDISSQPVSDQNQMEQGTAAAADFSVRLFQKSLSQDQNIMISPLSLLYALSMTANGAKGETLSQIEAVLGMPVSDQNLYLHNCLHSLSSDEKNKLNTANSIWFKEDPGLTIEKDFLQVNTEYYNASINEVPFRDETVDEINSWVAQNTDNMIKKILNSIPENAVMYLINTLAFDGKWENPYEQDYVQEGTFTAQSGEKQTARMMFSEEEKYLEDESAQGFLKYYAGSQYAFAALLPNDGISITDYTASLTGEKLLSLLENAEYTPVNTLTPVFTSECSLEMKEILQTMGIKDAFQEELADFTGLGHSTDGNLYISSVLQKTYISVDEQGTKASAATSIEMVAESAAVISTKEVILNRPFLYMIIDCDTNLPVFMGALMDIE